MRQLANPAPTVEDRGLPAGLIELAKIASWFVWAGGLSEEKVRKWWGNRHPRFTPLGGIVPRDCSKGFGVDVTSLILHPGDSRICCCNVQLLTSKKAEPGLNAHFNCIDPLEVFSHRQIALAILFPGTGCTAVGNNDKMNGLKGALINVSSINLRRIEVLYGLTSFKGFFGEVIKQ